MKKDFWPVIQSDKSSAVAACYYCSAVLGDDHHIGCVVRKQTVVLQVVDKDGWHREFICEKPEDWPLDLINRYFDRFGIQYIWSDLEYHQVGKCGDTVRVSRFATPHDEDTLLNISSRKCERSSNEKT